MDRNDFFKACQSHAIGKTVTVEYDSIAYYPIAYQLAYNADGTIRHTAVLRDIQSNSEIYCRLADVQNKKQKSVDKQNNVKYNTKHKEVNRHCPKQT